MTIVSDSDVRDGQPYIDGTRVTVIDVYEAYARDGLEPAEVASEYDVELAQVHEALAYYYNHAQALEEYRDHEFDANEFLEENQTADEL